MCLLIFAHRLTPELPLVIAANRDEFHARPTAAAAFQESDPDLLAGRDLEAGGTWMGITRGGRFAAVTNFRDPARSAEAPLSRGDLPLQYLQGNQSPADYLRNVARRASQYAGFNLLVGDTEALWYLNNSRDAKPARRLQPGIYGLSNARLDTPWPKVELARERLSALLDAARPSHEALARVVADRRLADPAELRLQGMDDEMERALSAQFIVTPDYGTRATTTLWVDEQGAHWCERNFNSEGQVVSLREEAFALRAR